MAEPDQPNEDRPEGEPDAPERPPSDERGPLNPDGTANAGPGEHFPEAEPHGADRTARRRSGSGASRPAPAADLPPGQRDLSASATVRDDAQAGPYSAASHQPASLRHIDWASAFPFVHLFKGFRLAAHPSKLLLALAAILLMYVGGRVLDGIWLSDHQAFGGEAEAFDEHVTRGAAVSDFRDVRRAAREQARADYDALRREAAVRQQARGSNVQTSEIDLGDIRSIILEERDARLRQAHERYNAQITAANAEPRPEGGAARPAIDEDQVERQYANEQRDAYEAAARNWEEVNAIRGRGLFSEFYIYEVRQFDGALASVVRLDAPGLLGHLYRALYVGPLWGFSQHPLYFSLFFLWLLLLAAIFGGAITRIAAVQVARDEKISLRSALRFSTGKFVSFLSAPLIPVLIILVLGLLVGLPGLLANFDWGIGDAAMVLLGALFVLGLIAGFVITLVLIGLVGGFSLMYPTIAAEGTDSFDAISRGFSYLYARPWQLAFYAIVALLYGAITYLFVRLFVWLVLVATHAAAGILIWRNAAGREDVLDALWPSPASFRDLSYDIAFLNLNWGQDLAAALISFWVYLVMALVPAYALSLYFSLSTIIYFLMRREVDATELDDVYIDPHDDELGGYADVPDAESDAPLEPEEPVSAAKPE